MSAVVVFESMFGNTEKIARAVADGVRSGLGASAADVAVLEVGKAPDRLDDEVSLLVAGGPTHAFGMTRPSTRDDARKLAGDTVVSHGIGLREWLDSVTIDRSDLTTATFDTRIDKVRHLPGSAARGAAKLLRRRGHAVLVTPQSFYVSDTEGPLSDGEVDHARRWGEEVGRAHRGLRARTGA